MPLFQLYIANRISLCEWFEWLIWADRGVVMDDMEQITIAPLMAEGLIFEGVNNFVSMEFEFS